MRAFKKKAGGYQAKIEAGEAQLLISLLEQLIELLDVDEAAPPTSDDPFAQWAQELAGDDTAPEPVDDPVLQRLFPDAYRDDADAAADFRRFTETEQRRTKAREARVVLAALVASDEGHHPLRVEPDTVQAWLRTLNALRLSLSARLGIVDETSADELYQLPDTDPRSFMLAIYEFIGWIQESLLNCL